MRFCLIGVGCAALLIGCTNNNVNITATAAMQTAGTLDDDTTAAEVSSSATQALTTDTTADPGSSTGGGGTTNGDTTGDTTGGTTGDQSSTDTSAGTSGTTADPDTGSGDPVEPRYAVFGDCNQLGFMVADIEDGWNTINVVPPKGWGTIGVGVSHQHVYQMLAANNTIARYSLADKTWEPYIEGPLAITNKHGWIEWVGGDKLCMAYWGQQDLHCYDGADWRTIPLTVQSDWWASWDPETNELYIKPYKNNGFQVVDLDTDKVVRTVVGEAIDDAYHKCLFDYHDGHVYLDRAPNPVRVHSHNGASTTIIIPPLGPRGGGAHPLTGKVYMINDIYGKPESELQEYDPETTQTTLLPYKPWLVRPARVLFQAPTAG